MCLLLAVFAGRHITKEPVGGTGVQSPGFLAFKCAVVQGRKVNQGFSRFSDFKEK